MRVVTQAFKFKKERIERDSVPSIRAGLVAIPPLYNQYWYYAMELQPGVVTPGAKHLNFGLTRKLLSQCDVQGRSILDIGTMEAAVPVLASRRGAAKAVAVDMASFHDKIEAVKHYTRTDFDYYAGLTHGHTIPFLKSQGHTSFDIVVLSGVLYHCFGPLHTLAMARSLVRTGGLVLVETFAIVDSAHSMHFNAGGLYTPDPSSYFLLSVPLLEYVLRYFKLLPIDCLHGQPGPQRTTRIATVCRAVDDIVPDPGDEWMQEATKIVDYVTLIDWEGVDRGDPVGYASPDTRINLYDAVTQTPFTWTQPDDVVIRLADKI